jgi:hypothetical protein
MDPVIDDILESTAVIPLQKTKGKDKNLSLNSPVSFDLERSTARVITATPANKRCRSLSPVVKKGISFPFHTRRSKATQIEEAVPTENPTHEDLTGAFMALSNADEVLAKATDSFKKTFDFIARTIESDDAPLSPSTTSTRPKTPSPTSPSVPRGTIKGNKPITNLLAPSRRPVASNDSDEYDPIMASRSFRSSSPVPELGLNSSADTMSSSRKRLSRAKCAAENWTGRAMYGAKVGDSITVSEASAAADRERALLKLQNSLSNLGQAISTAAWGTDANQHGDLPSLLHNSSTALTIEESIDPASVTNESTASILKVSNQPELAAIATGRKEFSINSNTSNHTTDRDFGPLRLHDSLSVLPSHAFDLAWMSYCDLPSLLQSHSSVPSFDGAQESTASAIATEKEISSTQSQHDGIDYVLVGRASPTQNIACATEQLRAASHMEKAHSDAEHVLTHEEAIVKMQASLGDLMSTFQSSMFGEDDDLVQTCLESNKQGATNRLCPSPQLGGQKRRALEPEEKIEFTGDRKRIGLEPEEHADFGVDELLIKVENEEITCLTEESYEVVNKTKYYPVEVASSGLGIPRCEQSTTICQHEFSEYESFGDEMVERHIQASFYLEDPLVAVPLDPALEVQPSPNGRHIGKWAALSYHSSRAFETDETDEGEVYSPSIELTDDITDNQVIRTKGEDPPGLGPWPVSCLEPCLAESAETSLTSSNFFFCHQSPKDLGDSLSASLLEISSQVQKMDEEHLVSQQVSQSVTELGSVLTSIWKQTDQALGVSVATKQVSTVLKEAAKNPPKPEDFQRHLLQIEEEHRIVEQTASVVADGALYLAQSIESLSVGSHRPETLLITGTA